MKNLPAIFLVCLISAFVVNSALAASKTVTVTPQNFTAAGGGVAQGGYGAACATSAQLGLTKTWEAQCNAKVYVRRACSTSSAGCVGDAGYGDTIYDFTTIANVRTHDPVRIQLRSTESQICFRNVAQPTDGSTADAGDTFTCMLNEDSPF